MIAALTAIAYVLSLTWLAASLCAGGVWLGPILTATLISAALFGWQLHRRIYGKRR